MTVAADIAGFENGLRKLATQWRNLPPEEEPGEFLVHLEAWNECGSIRMDASAYEIDAEDNEETIQVTIALYERERGFMFDAGYGLSYYAKALSLAASVMNETLVIHVSERNGVWCGSSLDEPGKAQLALGYARSWFGTHDRGP